MEKATVFKSNRSQSSSSTFQKKLGIYETYGVHDAFADTILRLFHHTRHLSSCLFVGCTHSPRSHSYLCSRGFAPLPSRCILKSIRYTLFYTKRSYITSFLSSSGHTVNPIF